MHTDASAQLAKVGSHSCVDFHLYVRALRCFLEH